MNEKTITNQKALVIREVPLEEAGIMGKILAKRRTK